MERRYQIKFLNLPGDPKQGYGRHPTNGIGKLVMEHNTLVNKDLLFLHTKDETGKSISTLASTITGLVNTCPFLTQPEIIDNGLVWWNNPETNIGDLYMVVHHFSPGGKANKMESVRIFKPDVGQIDVSAADLISIVGAISPKVTWVIHYDWEELRGADWVWASQLYDNIENEKDVILLKCPCCDRFP